MGELNAITLTEMISKFLAMLLFLLKDQQQQNTGNEETNLCKVIAPSPSISTDMRKLFLLQHM